MTTAEPALVPKVALQSSLKFCAGFANDANGQSYDRGELAVCWRGLNNPYFNCVNYVASSAVIAQSVINEAVEILTAGLPSASCFVVWTVEPSAPKINGEQLVLHHSLVFQHLGLSHKAASTTSQANLTVRQATGEEDNQRMLRLWCSATGQAQDAAAAEFAVVRHRMQTVLVFLPDRSEPVSTASVIISGGVSLLGVVATEPEYQRRGLAQVAAREALKLAQGDEAFVESTPAGLRLYEILGFQKMAYKHVYTLR